MEKEEIIDTDELRAFEAVASRNSFSGAAAQLGIAQSSVSQQVARLERRVDRLLVRRTTRRVELTPEGQAMLIYARSILTIAEDARRRLRTPPVDGVLKVGIADEFATTKLALLLGIFRSQYPRFEMQFLTGRNDYLHHALQARDVDLILGKAHTEERKGELLWRETLVWVGQARALGGADDPIPLLAYLRPSETRDVAEAALLAARRTWTVVAQGDNLLGLLAAAEAGLGVMALGRNFVPSWLQEIPSEAGLPPLGTLDYVMVQRPGAKDPAVEAFSIVLSGFARTLAAD